MKEKSDDRRYIVDDHMNKITYRKPRRKWFFTEEMEVGYPTWGHAHSELVRRRTAQLASSKDAVKEAERSLKTAQNMKPKPLAP